MKSIEEFIERDINPYIPADCTFTDVMNKYNELTKIIEEYKEIIKKYESEGRILTYSEYKEHTSKYIMKLFYYITSKKREPEKIVDLSSIEQINIYNTIQYLFKDEEDEKINKEDIDLIEVEAEIIESYPDLKKYLYAKGLVERLIMDRNELIEYISFYKFSAPKYHECCSEFKHTFIRLPNELKCVYCGASTKDYNLTEEQLDFLTNCAKDKNLLLKKATEADLHLIRFLIAKQEYIISSNQPTDDIYDRYPNLTEEEFDAFFYDDSLVKFAGFDLKCNIEVAHRLDKKEYGEKDGLLVENPKYLSDEETQKLLESINQDIKRAESLDSDNKYKPLLIEMCKTIKYEILIVSGYHIPTLYNETQEKEKIYVAKAYFNLTDFKHREGTGYFKMNEFGIKGEADQYKYLTANPEINELVLRIKK